METVDNINLSDGDFKSFTVDNIKYGDRYTNIQLKDIEDIFVAGEQPGMSLRDKYDAPKSSHGVVHMAGGLSAAIENAKVKSLHLKGKFLHTLSFKTRRDVEEKLGKPDTELTDGIMWGTDYVIDATVLVYWNKNLYIHIDPVSDELKELRFGNIDENQYYG